MLDKGPFLPMEEEVKDLSKVDLGISSPTGPFHRARVDGMPCTLLIQMTILVCMVRRIIVGKAHYWELNQL